MTKRKLKFKPLIIAAAITLTLTLSFLTVNASFHGNALNFLMGGEKIEGEYYDYVDGDGFRRVSFEATMPIYEENFAVIFDADAPQDQNIRVITPDNDPEFIKKLCLYNKVVDEAFEAIKRSENVSLPKPEDMGLVFKDSELCLYRLGEVSEYNYDVLCGDLGGKFMQTGNAEGHPSGIGGLDPNKCVYDRENGTKFYKVSFYYYVGKESG